MKSKLWVREVLSLLMYTAIAVSLKLVGILTWDWIWVFAPIWVPLSILLIAVVGAAIQTAYKYSKRDKCKSSTKTEKRE